MPGPQPKPPESRFWPKVDRSGGPDSCWLWTGGVAGSGYGQFYRRKREPVGAHRFSWELANGRLVPAGMQVMHSCDVRPCVNPRHLSIGTCSDNAWDKSRKGRNPGNRTKGRPEIRQVDDERVGALRAAGLTYQQIADELGVARSTAFRSVRRSEAA
jgi:hypothetical protein